MVVPSNIKIYHSLIFFAEKIYTDIKKDASPEYIRICNESVIKLLKSTWKTLGIILLSVVMFLIFPVYAFVVNHDLQLPIPVLLPFTDLNSSNAIALNLFNQMFISLNGGTGNVGIEMITFILKNTVWASTMAICYSIDEFSNLITHSESNSSTTVLYTFRNIVIQLQDQNQ